MKLPFEIFQEVSHDDTENRVSSFNNLVMGVKLQYDGMMDSGVMIGYGMAMEFPTGNHDVHIGNDEIYFLNPFVSLGFKPSDKMQLIVSGRFNIPLNSDPAESEDAELVFAAAAVYSVSPEFRVMLELDGDVPLEGSSSGDQIVNLSPSMHYKLPGGLDVGLAVGFPITDMEHFQMRIVSSLLYEF